MSDSIFLKNYDNLMRFTILKLLALRLNYDNVFVFGTRREWLSWTIWTIEVKVLTSLWLEVMTNLNGRKICTTPKPLYKKTICHYFKLNWKLNLSDQIFFSSGFLNFKLSTQNNHSNNWRAFQRLFQLLIRNHQK